MKRQRKVTAYHAYHFQRELDAIKHQMGLAMQQAYTPFIAKRGRFTLHMEAVWDSYVDWARRAERAGLIILVGLLLLGGCTALPRKTHVLASPAKIKQYDLDVPKDGTIVCDTSNCRVVE